MLEDEAFEDGLRGLAFVFVELLQRLELQAQGIVRAALVLVEQQLVGADGKRLGQLADHLQRGLGVALLVALDLGDVDAGQIGQGLLGELAVLAVPDQALRRLLECP